MQDTVGWFDQLIQCLKLVASDAEHQIKLFPRNAHIADEIALEYNSKLDRLDDFYSENFINQDQMNQFKQIDDLFTRMSDDKSKSYWNLEALRNAPEWAQARKMARELLDSLGIKEYRPNRNWW
jgi:hypothetical protein